jgi:sporulation protein YlmC with PRC-barrel domain
VLAAVTLVIGSDARCSDGFGGQVLCLVVDPAARTVTHLVVEPEGRAGLARLVPLEIVEATAGQLLLRCTESEFKDLRPAEEMLAEFVRGSAAPVQLVPEGWRDAGDEPALDASTCDPLRTPEKEVIDIVPAGEVEERRGDHVHATDGDIGQVQAFRIDAVSHRVTHVLLREGHFLGRRNVAIPADRVTGFGDGIRLDITRQQVRDLPLADADPPARPWH